MKKILIMHMSNTLNYGSMMMGENIIHYISKNIKNVEFFIDAKEVFHIDRLKEASCYKDIFLDKQLVYNKRIRNNKYLMFLEELIKLPKHLKKANKHYDKIIVIGGDDYSEVYHKIPRDSILIKHTLNELDLLNRNNKLIMVGQTIGPYTGVRKKWASKTFGKVQLYTRDDVCADYMANELDVKVHKSRDLAFLDLGLQKKYPIKETLKKYNIKEDEYITIVSSGLSHLYTKNIEDFSKTFVDLIKELKNKYPNKKIVWLSHVVTRNSKINDNAILDKINELYDDYINKNTIVIRDEILPIEARTVLGNGYFTISCRMHSAVSTFQMGKPAICLSYSPKYSGVIGDGLDSRELVIEAKDESLWKGPLVKQVIDKCDYIEKNYLKLVKKINKQVKLAQEIVSKTMEELVENINENKENNIK